MKMGGEPKAAKTRYYFAYGSNCNLDQMERRCPAARVIGRVTLPNYALSFNGKTSGWGVANIHRKRGMGVKGLLWAITPECERNLDRYEGYPTLYEKRNVKVRTEDDATIKAMVYVMTGEHNSPALPSKGYYEGIVA